MSSSAYFEKNVPIEPSAAAGAGISMAAGLIDEADAPVLARWDIPLLTLQRRCGSEPEPVSSIRRGDQALSRISRCLRCSAARIGVRNTGAAARPTRPSPPTRGPPCGQSAHPAQRTSPDRRRAKPGDRHGRGCPRRSSGGPGPRGPPRASSLNAPPRRKSRETHPPFVARRSPARLAHARGSGVGARVQTDGEGRRRLRVLRRGRPRSRERRRHPG